MLVAGQMSGTSLDGVDTVVCEITGEGDSVKATIVESATQTFPPKLRNALAEAAAGNPLSTFQQAQIEIDLANCYAHVIQNLESKPDLIGCHGQTVYHLPPSQASLGISYQWVHAPTLAQKTKCPVITHFRQADMALGGQGAPIVPRVDAALLGSKIETRVAINIGGIANVSLLPRGANVHATRGWDTGPGNSLIDLFVQKFFDRPYDAGGEIAASGAPNQSWINRWMDMPYFHQAPPKSTGRELFGWEFFANLPLAEMSGKDWVATATAFTALSIADSLNRFIDVPIHRILVCGGGAKNTVLIELLGAAIPSTPIHSTTEYGVDANFKEAQAMAVLAYWHIQNHPGNLPEVTGASKETVLGVLTAPF